jgi:lysophospholipid acyltransferase (LPLAT)-like uncharacterized protein
MATVVFLGFWFLRILGATWRIREYGRDAEQRASRSVFAFWHRCIVSLAQLYRNQGHCVLVSQHRDGEIIARIAERFGFVCARGSSTRGGWQGLKDVVRFMASSSSQVSITPDGPRGPAEKVKPGVVFAAQLAHCPVTPVGVAADRVWRFKSWDRFELPKPFARIAVFWGPEIAVPARTTNEETDSLCLRIEQGLLEANARSRELVERRASPAAGVSVERPLS